MKLFSDSSAVSARLPRSSRRQRGLGLLEMMICISIMALVFLAAMTMILSASRSTARTQAQVFSNSDAANAIQNIIGQLREASAFSLPTSTTANTAETTWNSMGGTSLSQFSTTLNGETINTALQIVAPPLMTPAANGYTASVPTLRVLSTTGGYWQAGQGTWSAAPCNVQLQGGVGVTGSSVVVIYRGDPDTTPDAAAGTYLWQYTLPADSSFNTVKYPPVALCKSVSTSPNAVQFVRASYQNVAEQNQLEIKVISSYFSPINGQQTNEQGSGASSSQLSGKCVFMRDHYTGSPLAPANSGARTGNNAFQYH